MYSSDTDSGHNIYILQQLNENNLLPQRLIAKPKGKGAEPGSKRNR